MSPPDPFYFKRFSKLDPRRIGFALYTRVAEIHSRTRFGHYKVARLETSNSDVRLDLPVGETAVTKAQMRMLITSIRKTEDICGAIVEVGVFRGVTTAALAEQTKRRYFAVDPYIGYGGTEDDQVAMLNRIQHLKNVRHLRLTSGDAIQAIRGTPLSFVFVDAVHDYVNVRFDGVSWGKSICPHGMIAFHDTDSYRFPGVQRVVWNLIQVKSDYELFGHINGLAVLRKLPDLSRPLLQQME